MNKITRKEIFEKKKVYIERKLGPSVPYNRVISDLFFAGALNSGAMANAKSEYKKILMFMVDNNIKPYITFYSDFKLPWSNKPFFDQLQAKSSVAIRMINGPDDAEKPKEDLVSTVKKRPALRTGDTFPEFEEIKKKKRGRPPKMRTEKPVNKIEEKKAIDKAEKLDEKDNMEKVEDEILETTKPEKQKSFYDLLLEEKDLIKKDHEKFVDELALLENQISKANLALSAIDDLIKIYKI